MNRYNEFSRQVLICLCLTFTGFNTQAQTVYYNNAGTLTDGGGAFVNLSTSIAANAAFNFSYTSATAGSQIQLWDALGGGSFAFVLTGGSGNVAANSFAFVATKFSILPAGLSASVTGLCIFSASTCAGGSSSGGTAEAPVTTWTIGPGSVTSISSIPATVTSIVMNGGFLSVSNETNSVFWMPSIVLGPNGGVINLMPPQFATMLSGISGPGRLSVVTNQRLANVKFEGTNTHTGGVFIGPNVFATMDGWTNENATPLGTGPVDNYGWLGGSGTIVGTLTNYGRFKPGNSPGFIQARSSVILNSGSIYQQDIAGKVQASVNTPIGATGYYSFLSVGVSLVINSGSTLAPALQNLFTASEAGYGTAPYVPALGDRFRMITALGGISGQFSTVNQPAGLASGTQFVPFYNMLGSNSVDLAVIPSSYQTTVASAAGNSNAQSVANALDQVATMQLTGAASAAQSKLLHAISGQTSSAGVAAYTQSIAGEVYPAAVAVIAQNTQRVQQSVMNRLGDSMEIGLPNPAAASAGNAASMNNANTAITGGTPTAWISSNPNVNPTVDNKSFSNGNVWGDLTYQKGSRNADGNSGGWSSNLYQLVFGSDFYVADGMRLGGGFALSNTTLTPAYGTGTIQQGSLFAYGKMPIDEYILDAMISIGLNSSDLSRRDITSYTSSGYSQKSNMGGDALASIGISRPFDVQNFRVTPFARVTWQMVTQTGVSETSTSALAINSYSGSGVRGLLGISAGSKSNNPLNEDFTYRAYLAVGADSSGLLNPSMSASLAGLSTTINTPNVGTTFLQVGLYGTAKFSDNAYAYLGLSGETRSGQTLGAINAGLRIQF
jgi:hypothetical protein